MLTLRGDLLALLPQFLEAVYDLLTGVQSEAALTGENGTLTLSRSHGSVHLRLVEGENRKPLQMRVTLRELAAASVKGVEAFQSQVKEVSSALTLHPIMQRIVSLQHTLQEILAAYAKQPLRQRLNAYLPSQPPRTLNALFVCLVALVVFQSVLLWRNRHAATPPLRLDAEALRNSPYQPKAKGERRKAKTTAFSLSTLRPSPLVSPPAPAIPGGQMAEPPIRFSRQPDSSLPPGGLAPVTIETRPMGAASPQPPLTPPYKGGEGGGAPPAKLVGVIEYNGESTAVLEMGNNTVYKKKGDRLNEDWKIVAVLENRVELQRTVRAADAQSKPQKTETTTLVMSP